ncbi:MAG: hypothetical protein ACYSSI_11040 [Planctomycetota bacterium]|jgi:hypothetical protein
MKKVRIKITIGVLIVFCLVIVFFKFIPTKQKETNSKTVEPEGQKTITRVLPDRPDTRRMVVSSKNEQVTVEKPSLPPVSFKNKADNSQAPVGGPVRDVQWEEQRASSLLKVVTLHFRRAQREPEYYKTMIEFSRKIFEEFPDSEEALQARELLKEVPGKYLEKYGVTDEELGVFGNI